MFHYRRIRLLPQVGTSNIFIQDDGTAKILDFGIARISSSKLTIAGKVLGTPNYMAPEQINRRQCDARSDLFSAAIVFFEFLVYSHPFQSSFIPRRIVEDDPDTLFDRDPLIPQSLADLLYKALQKRPESRVQTAVEFGAGLRAVLQELRTGLAAEPFIQTASPAPLPDPTPSTEASSDSPDGRLAGFVQMLSDFEAAVEVSDLVSARAIIADMARLESADTRFSEALCECRDKLEKFQRATRVTVAAAGETYSEPPMAGISAKLGPNGSATSSPKSPGWDDDRSIFNDRTVTTSEHGPERWNTETLEVFGRVCDACGVNNRDAATYCQNCGKPMDQPSPLADQADAPAPSTFGDKAVEVWAAIVEKVRAGIQVISEKGRHLWARGLALPRGTQYAIGGVLALCVVTAIALPFAVGALRPVPLQKPVGTATVQTAQTALMETEAPASKQLMTLQRGTELNVLSRIADPGQRFVRVQLVVRNKANPPGFVALADLGQWTSSDSVVEWEYLGLGRPGAGASPEAAGLFSRTLTTFRDKFPGTSQARLAALEQAEIHMRLAEEAKAAGKERAQWLSDFELAKKALDAAGINEASSEGEKRLVARLQELDKEESEQEVVAGGPQSAKKLAESAEVANYLRKAEAAWYGGDIDACEAYAKKTQALAPKNKQAGAWLWQVQKSREQ